MEKPRIGHIIAVYYSIINLNRINAALIRYFRPGQISIPGFDSFTCTLNLQPLGAIDKI